jgi:hypothetical protein
MDVIIHDQNLQPVELISHFTPSIAPPKYGSDGVRLA